MAENLFLRPAALTPQQDVELPDAPTLKPSRPRTRSAASTMSADGLMPPEDVSLMIEEASASEGVPMNILAALAQNESSYRADAIGEPTKYGEAKGMMQYIDSTAKGMGIDPLDARQSIFAAAKQLRQRLDKGESMEDAVKAHFAGDDRAQWGEKTAEYGRKVMEKAGLIGQQMMGGKAAPAEPEPQADDLGAIQKELDAKEPGRYKVIDPAEIERRNELREGIASGKGARQAAQDAVGAYEAPSPYPMATQERIEAKVNAQQPPSPLTITNQERVKAGIAPKEDLPPDGFLSATSKQLQNVPGHFKNAAGGLIGSFGERVDDQTLVSNAQNAGIIDRMKDNGTITMVQDARGNFTPTLPDGKPGDISAVAAYIRKNAGDLMSTEEAGSLLGMKPNEVAAYGRQLSKEANRDELKVNPDGPLAKYGSMIIGSTAEMVPAILAGVVTRNPATAMSIIGGQVYGQSYDKARQGKMNPQDAATYAMANAVAEAIPEALPLHFILKPGQNFFKGILSAGAAEAVQESVTQAIQSGLDKGSINPNMTWKEAREQIADAAIVGAGSGAALRAGVHGLQSIPLPGGNREADAAAAGRVEPTLDESQMPPPDDLAPTGEAPPAQAPAPEPAPEAAAPAPTAPDGPLTRAARRAIPDVPPAPEVAPVVEQEEPGEPVTVRSADGEMVGTLESYTQTADGGFSARVIGDDGNTYDFTQDDGVTIERAQQPEAEPAQTSPVEQPAPAPETEPSPAAVEEPAAAAPETSPLGDMTEAQLRGELKAVTQALKTDAGNAELKARKKAVTKAINDGAGATPAADEQAGDKINKAWTKFADDSGSLNVPREDMPQIKAEHRGAMVNFLNARGIESEQDEVPASSLKPTQGEFSPGRVKKAREFQGGERSILVSGDGHILDGHHQWLAKLDGDAPVKVIRLKAPIKQLLDDVRAFPSATNGNGANGGKPDVKEKAPEVKPAAEADTPNVEYVKPADDVPAHLKPGKYPRYGLEEGEEDLSPGFRRDEETGHLPRTAEAVEESIKHNNQYLLDYKSNPKNSVFSTPLELQIIRRAIVDRLDQLRERFGYTEEQIDAVKDRLPDIPLPKPGDKFPFGGRGVATVLEASPAGVKARKMGKEFTLAVSQYQSNVLQGRHDAASKAAKAESEPAKPASKPGKPASKEVESETPKKLTKKQQGEENARKLAEHYTPGNILKNAYWGNFEQVEAFQQDANGFSVTVQTVEQRDGEWVPVGPPRTHQTAPSAKDTVVERAATAPAVEAPAKPAVEAKPAAKAEKPAEYGASNKLVSQDRAAELKAKLKAKLNGSQLNAGIDPEILAMGAELAVFHIEAGVRQFASFAKTMADDLDMPLSKIRPYLRGWYNGARDMMEDNDVSIAGMDDATEVRAALARLDAGETAEAEPSALQQWQARMEANGAKRIEHDGEQWFYYPGSAGTVREDGKQFTHLSHVDQGRQQKNGWNPRQASDYVDRGQAEGDTDTVVTPGGREFEVREKVVEASSLITSNSADGKVNPAYPKALQPRDRARSASLAQINDIAANLNPKLLGKNPSASDGAPIVSPDGVVESGNGRALGIQKAYANGNADAYRAYIESQGHDTSGMTAPVLVRERVTPMSEAELVDYTTAANERTTLALSATEQAQADARKLGAILHLFEGGDINAAANRDFVRAFVGEVVGKADRGAMMDASGLLSQAGRRRAEAALLSAAYEDPGMVSDLFESADSDIKSIGGALLDVAGPWAQMRQEAKAGNISSGVDVTPNLMEAVALVRRARAEGRSIAELVGQNDMFSGSLDPVTKDFLRTFYRGDSFSRARSRANVAGALLEYTQLARATQPGANLFGDAELTGADLIRGANAKLETSEKQAGQQQDIFGGPRADDAGAGQSGGKGQRPQPAPGSEAPAAEGDEVNATGNHAGVERDSGQRKSGKPVDADAVPTEPGEDGRGTGEPGAGAGKGGVLGQRDQRLPTDGAAARGEQSHQPVHQPDGQYRPTPWPAGGEQPAGSGGDSVDGPAVERERASDVAGATPATDTRAFSERLKAQKAADGEPTIRGDKASIDRALPLLLDPQRDDVKKIEDRHAVGNGMLLTNGTGTGKTASGMGTIKRTINEGKDNIIVVVPSDKIASDWVKFGGMMQVGIKPLTGLTDNGGSGPVITTYANFGNNATLAQRDWDLVVTDESHYLSSNEKGESTDALEQLRALTGHHAGFYKWVRERNPDVWLPYREAMIASKEANAPYSEVSQHDKDKLAEAEAKQRAKWLAVEEPARKAWDARWAAQANLPKTLFLSATPFAYVKNIDYAEGYLFDYTPPADLKKAEGHFGAYNEGDARQKYLMSNFGYRMRTNKLTAPESGVNAELLEQNFNQMLKDQGSLSGRRLEVEPDYDRKFVLVDDAIGQKIDDGLKFLSETEDGKYRDVYKAVMDQFPYQERLYLLEAIKARASVDIIKAHMKLGRKVVVFHDYNKGGGFDPFQNALRHMPDEETRSLAKQAYAERPDLFKLSLTGLQSPIVTLSKAFPDALFFNGTVSKQDRRANADTFNTDGNGSDLIVVQSDAGREGVSLHDTSGKHQRVLLNLGMPSKPVASIQIEGRTYRTGQATNAPFRYLTTGTAWEASTFASKIAERAGTAENLALGPDARGLKQSFIDAYQDADVYPASTEDGQGGKAYDRAMSAGTSISPYNKAKTYYYAQQKNTRRRDQRQGDDYYATPEPLGFKMAEWADIREGDKALEPSAGHGAIARFFPPLADVTMVEPSYELSQRAALANGTARIVNDKFENLHISNKYDGIVMNPPYGSGGKTAVEHLAKAAGHAREGGRVVALIPRGGLTEKRLEAFLDTDLGKTLQPVATVKLPGIAFERAGTGVNTQVLIFEKHSNDLGAKAIQRRTVDLSHVDSVNELFDELEHVGMQERTPPVKPEQKVELIEHVTGKGKKLLGIVRSDLSKAEAQEIDPFTFKKGDGWFIRQKHLKDDMLSVGTEPAEPGHVENITGTLIEGRIGRQVQRLIDNGRVRVHASADSIPGEVVPGMQAKTTADGVIHLLASNLDTGTALPVLFHEMFHSGGQALVGSARWNALMGRLAALQAQYQQSTGKAGDFFEQARQRVQQAVEAGDKMTPEVSTEEFAAYAIEQYEQAPATVRKWVDNLIGAIKEFAYRQFGIQLGQVSPAQLRAMALQAIRKQSAGARAEEAASMTRATSTPAFKNWFGKSVVVDEDGDPAIVHHFTYGDFNEFDRQWAAREFGRNPEGIDTLGSWFTDNDKARYVNPERGRRMDVYLAIKKPFYIDDNKDGDAFIQLNDMVKEAGGSSALRERLQTQGYDGVILNGTLLDGVRQNAIVAFEPNQIKSATNNFGGFDDENPDIRYSVRASKHFTDLNADQKDFLDKIGPEKLPQRLKDRWNQLTDNLGLRFRQAGVDRYAALLRNDQALHGADTLEGSIASSAWVLARMSQAAGGALNAMLNSGRIYLDKNQKVIDIKDNTTGLADTLRKLGTPQEIERFMGWIAANRSKGLYAEGRENLFTKAQIDAGIKLSGGRLDDGKSRSLMYAQTWKDFQTYRDDVLGIAEDTGIITPEQRQTWANEFYVPFYRVTDEENVGGPSSTSGLSRQQAFKKLKGGKQNLNDLLENTLMNYHHLLQASLKNQAAAQAVENAEQLGIADKTTEAKRDKDSSTFVMVDGEKQWYNISDPLTFKAVSALSNVGLNHPVMKAGRAFKRFFTNMTTITPQFVIANGIRDTLAAMATSPTSAVPLKTAFKGALTYGNNRQRARMMASGGAFAFGHVYGQSADDVKASMPGMMRGAKVLRDPALIPKLLLGAWHKYHEATDFAENINRAGIWEHNQGRGKLKAAFEARDLMDFSAHGDSLVMRMAIDLLPFLNARVQGMDKLYRSGFKPGAKSLIGKGSQADKKSFARFAAVTGALTLFSALLYLRNKDDEDYRKLEDWQRDTYWPIKIGDSMFFVPKPFEVGSIATMGERLLEQFTDPTVGGDKFAKRLGHVLMDTFAMNPVPQMIRPLTELATNENSFTGRPIEDVSMQKTSPSMRARPDTTRLAEASSRAIEASLDLVGAKSAALSPVQIDHLIQGYAGAVGATAVGLADTLWRTAQGEELPAKRWDEYQPVKRFYKDLTKEENYTRYGTDFYEALKKASQDYADLQHLNQYGEEERAAALEEKAKDSLGMRKQLGKISRDLAKINADMKRIQLDKTMDGETKRIELDRARSLRNLITEDVGKDLERMKMERRATAE